MYKPTWHKKVIRMNATDYLQFKLPMETVGKMQVEGSKLIPHPDDGTKRMPSSTKLISRLTENGSSN